LLTLPHPGSRARLLTIGFGAVVFFWLSAEDNSALPVAIFGTGISVAIVFWWLSRNYGGKALDRRFWFPGLIFAGGITGAGAALSAVLLMFFKTAWHSHVFPDYPLPMMLAMLERLPAWTLAGALVGLAVALIYTALAKD
jgi:hypothetical protein